METNWNREWFKQRAIEYHTDLRGKLDPTLDDDSINDYANFAISIQEFMTREQEEIRKSLGIKKDEDLTHKERTAQLKEMLENKTKEYWKKTDGFLITEISFTYYWGQYDLSPTPHCIIKQEYK